MKRLALFLALTLTSAVAQNKPTQPPDGGIQACKPGQTCECLIGGRPQPPCLVNH